MVRNWLGDVDRLQRKWSLRYMGEGKGGRIWSRSIGADSREMAL
jgi:hypothetical protein